MSLLILKIGGSVITEKSTISFVRKKEIDRISREIASFKENSQDAIILVHGAGSFGHPQAMKWVIGGFDMQDVYITHKSVKLLNSIVLDSLNNVGIKVLPVHPLSSCVLENGNIVEFNVIQIKLMLERGVIPVLHGDVVMDRIKGAAVLSGDRIVPYLASVLGASKIGAGSNVDGVFDDTGAVIKKITPVNFVDIKKHLQEASSADVTGSMLGKVTEFLELAKSGTSSRIFNASREGMVSRFLYGEDIGTLITDK